MMGLVRFFLDPRVLAVLPVLLVAGAVGLGWWHYTGLKSDLATTQADLATAKADLEVARAQMRAAVEIAQGNAEQVKKLEPQQRAVIAAIEQAHEEIAKIADEARAAEQEIVAAPEEHDGPVAPLLEDLRRKRFGGQP